MCPEGETFGFFLLPNYFNQEKKSPNNSIN